MPEFIVEFWKLVAPGLPSAFALLAGLYLGHVLTRRQSGEDFDRQREAAAEDRETLRAEFVADRDKEREMFVADRAEDRKAEVDREQRDWERRLVKEVCAPAMASTEAAGMALRELEAFVSRFQEGNLLASDAPLDQNALKLAIRIADTYLEMSADVRRLGSSVGIRTSSAILLAFYQLQKDPLPDDMERMFDGDHDAELEALSEDLQERVNGCTILGRVLGSLVLNPPPSNSPADVEAFEDLVISFLGLADPDSDPESGGDADKLDAG